MTARSLRLRLVLVSAASIALALLIAGTGIVALFERHVVRRIEGELDTYLRTLAAELSFGSEGGLLIAHQPADPRFAQPQSGLYWQIDDEVTSERLRSRSLWDHVIALPADLLEAGAVHQHALAGPGETMLLVAERRVIFPAANGGRPVRIAAAIDRREVSRATAAFATDMGLSLALLALVLMVAAWAQIAVGLRPLDALRRSVLAVRAGQRQRLAVDGPDEVMPLVAEVDSLLAAQEKAVESARARAADLAHGLKTPLTVLASDAERLRAMGVTEIAGELEELSVQMRQHVERELSRARLHVSARSGRESAPLRETVERVMKTLSRSPKGACLSWQIDVDQKVAVGLAPTDLTELLGVLLDNAVKWAEHEVRVFGASAEAGLHLTIEDDGPGVAQPGLARLGKRGVRLDEKVEGSGLGLAIAGDIVEAYGGRIAYEAREPHGFRVAIEIPVAETMQRN